MRSIVQMWNMADTGSSSSQVLWVAIRVAIRVAMRVAMRVAIRVAIRVGD